MCHFKMEDKIKKIIYYFSGTGNSLRTARIIATEIGGARLLSMGNLPENVPATDAEIIGIVCPVCGSKTRLKIREDTEPKTFPLYCPKCKQETLVFYIRPVELGWQKSVKRHFSAAGAGTRKAPKT